MGVYIKGFKYPKNCWQCPMVGGYELCDEVKMRYSTLHCRLTKTRTPAGENPKDCPLVPVPPHGRLIDADAIPYNKIMIEDDDFYYGITQPRIERMPTIIPAEEGE